MFTSGPRGVGGANRSDCVFSGLQRLAWSVTIFITKRAMRCDRGWLTSDNVHLKKREKKKFHFTSKHKLGPVRVNSKTSPIKNGHGIRVRPRYDEGINQLIKSGEAKFVRVNFHFTCY